MLLDLNELKRKGKDKENFFFEYFPAENFIDIPDTEIVLPIKINGEITLTGEHTAFVSADVEFSIKGNCTRCCKYTEREYFASFDEEFEGDSVVNDKIDLGKIVDDTVITNIPLNFLCKDDCKGICTGCGVNLNDAECKCKIKEGK